MPQLDPKPSQTAPVPPAYFLRAVQLLAEPKATFCSVAAALGIDRRTLFTWRQDPLYREAESLYLEGAVSAARAELKAMVLDAVAVYRDALECNAADRDEAAKWKIRLDTAKDLLSRVGIKAESMDDAPEPTSEELDAMLAKVFHQEQASRSKRSKASAH